VPPQPVQGGGQPYPYRRPKPRTKVEPIVVEVVRETVVVEAYCAPIFVGMSASANGAVTFSAEDDDLQVLLML
jgi:hypothetical protein